MLYINALCLNVGSSNRCELRAFNSNLRIKTQFFRVNKVSKIHVGKFKLKLLL